MDRIVGFVAAGALLAACGGVVKPGTTNGAVEQDGGSRGGKQGGSQGGGAAGISNDPGGYPMMVPWPSATGGSYGTAGGSASGGAFPGGYGGMGGIWPGNAGAPSTGGAVGLGGVACNQIQDGVQVYISGAQTTQEGGSPASDVVVSGRVTVSSGSELVVDACPANADCASIETKVSVVAPDLDLASVIPVGSLVTLHYANYGTPDLAVTSLSAWGGYTNDTPAQSGLYLAVDDGGGSLGEFPFKVEHVLLDCPTNFGGNCGGEQGLYAFRFYEPGLSAGVLIPMGDTVRNVMGGGTLSVRNLRSYATGWCNDNRNWAYWVANSRAP